MQFSLKLQKTYRIVLGFPNMCEMFMAATWHLWSGFLWLHDEHMTSLSNSEQMPIKRSVMHALGSQMTDLFVNQTKDAH